MPEPTAREALAAFAAELDSIADAEAGPDSFTGTATSRALKSAAALARGFAGPPPSVGTGSAQETAAATRGPEPGRGEGETSRTPDGDLGAAEPVVVARDELLTEWRRTHPGACSCPPGRRDLSCPQHGYSDALRAAQQAVHRVDCDDPECFGECAQGYAVAALLAAEPFIRADERKRAACCPTGCDTDCEQVCHEAHQVVFKRDHDPEVCKAAVVGAAVEAERARILAGAEVLKHTTHGKAVGIVDWAELADLIQGEQP